MAIEARPQITKANTEKLIAATNIADKSLTPHQTKIFNEYNRVRRSIVFGLALQDRYAGNLEGEGIEQLAAKEAAEIVPEGPEVLDLWIGAFRQALHK